MNFKSGLPLFLAILCALTVSPLFAQQNPNPNDFPQGMTAYKAGQYSIALEYFKAAVTFNPNSWQSYQMAGYCDYQLNHPDEMMTYLNESLKLNPNNPSLVDFLNRVKALAPSTASTPAVAQSASTKPLSAAGTSAGSTLTPPSLDIASKTASTAVKPNSTDSFWIKMGGLVNFEDLGELTSSADAWNNAVMQSAIGEATISNFGYGGQLEGALNFETISAISFKVNYNAGHDYSESVINNGTTTQNIDPQLWTYTLELYHYFPEKNGRLFLCGGPMLGQAIVPVNLTTPVSMTTGTLTGLGPGFDLGIGNEFFLSSNVSFEIAARFQYLVVGEVQNGYTDSNGNPGQMTLLQDSQGNVSVADSRNAGQSGSQYAVLNFSGVILDASFNWKLF